MINTCYISQSVLLNLAWMMLQWARYLHTQICDSIFIYFLLYQRRTTGKISGNEESKHTTGNKAFKSSQTVVELYCLLVRIERGVYCISRMVQLQQHVRNVYDLSARSSVVKVQRSLTFIKKKLELNSAFSSPQVKKVSLSFGLIHPHRAWIVWVLKRC